MSVLNDFLRYGCRHYAPHNVVVVRGQGVRVWDEADKEYIDAASGYSSNNFGHCHPRIMRIHAEMGIVPNSYVNLHLAKFVREVCERFGYEKALPMNTGVDVVEAAMKLLRKYAYTKRGIPRDRAEILFCTGNFHGRTIAAISASSEPQYRDLFGPHTPGFRLIPFGDANALDRAINDYTVGVFVEPIQGEGGVIIPPAGYMSAVARVCKNRGIIFVADEIQTGLGRTGAWLASWLEGAQPDVVLLAKSLGGGLVPASVLLTSKEIMVFEPGDHGSTYGGNAFAMCVARESLRIIDEEELCLRSHTMGARLLRNLQSIKSPLIRQVRGQGLMIGIELNSTVVSPSQMLDRLLAAGVLCKDAHGVLRITPPLIILPHEVDELSERIEKAIRFAA